MKRRAKITLIAACLAAALVLSALSGCGYREEEPTGVDGLSDGELVTIRRAYFDQYYQGDDAKYNINGIVILKYLGTYGGHIVVKLRDCAEPNVAVPQVEVNVTIDGIFIGNLNDPSYEYMVYLNPQQESEKAMLSLKDAYEKGCLTRADLIKVSAYEKKTA